MRTSLRPVFGATLMFGLALALSACPEDQKLPIGGSCNSGDQCISGLCNGQVCVDPQGDEDGDTLINSLEQSLGSDMSNADTDGDGIRDDDELDGVALADTDGDGLADIIESATFDSDGDCITDQYDAENTVQNADLSPMRDVVCSDLGVCAGQDRALFGVLCPDGVAVCDYTNVVGYVDPEASCDGVDDDCDGQADDGFPDQDGDQIADCVDTDFDNDEVTDDIDNCPFVANPEQGDAQNDGVGDACAADLDLDFTLAPIATLTAGAPFDATVRLQDADGNVVTRFHGDVALDLADAPAVTAAGTTSGATLTGTTTVTAVDGVATFTGLVIAPAATGLTLTAASGDLGGATSAPFDVLSGELAELRPTGAPTASTAGDALSVTLTAWDAYDNVLASYAGVVSFSSSDPAATLPDDYAYTTADAGAHTFAGLVLRTAGEQTITVSDATGATLATITVTVGAAAAASFTLAGLPETTTAGAATSLTISARDAFGNVADGFTGTVALTTTDDDATLPADHAFTAGDAGTYTTTGLVLVTAGAHTVTATSGELTGSADTTVVHADAAALVVVASPAPFTAGTPFSVTVTVVDAYGNVVTDFTGTVALSSTDPLATLPSAYTFSAADQGVHVFTGVTLVSSGQHGVSAQSAGGASVGGGATVTVESGSDVVFELTGVPDPATAGIPFDVTLTVKDTFGNVVTDYAGTISLLSSDGAASLPPAATLTAQSGGTTTFAGVTLKTAGAQTLTAADTAQGVSQSANVTVQAAAAASLTVAGPSDVTAGTPFSITVNAKDAFGNAATGYSATLSFTSSDDGATLPGDGTFAAGSGSQTYGGVAVTAAGAQTVTVSDPQSGALSATLNVTVGPAGAASVTLSQAPSTATAGQAFGLTATLYDAYGNVAAGYTGQLAVSTSDSAGQVPAAHTFTAGDAGAFSFSGITLKTAGDQTVTVAAPGNGALTASATVSVGPAAATTLVVTPSDSTVAAGVTTSVVVRADDAYGNRATGYTGAIHFATSDAQATIPVDYTFTAGDAGQHVFGGVVFRTVGAQTITATDLATASITGQAAITVGQGAQIVYELTGLPANAQAGSALTATLSVKDTFGNPITDYSGTVAFTAVDATTGQPVSGATLPPSYTFVGGDQGAHTFTGIVLTKAQTTTLRAAEVGSANVSASAVVNVVSASMSRLAIENAPSSATAGTAFGLRVTAYDAYDNVAVAYTGPVTFGASREGATLPSDGTLTAGTRSFTGLVLTLAGDTTITVSGGGKSTQVTLPVGHGAPASLGLTALPSSVVAGSPQSLTATVRDTWGNVATGFVGTASVVTNDPGVDATNLDFTASHQGQRTLTVTFETAGSRQVTVDAGGALSATRATTVTAGAATTFDVTALPGTLTAGTQRTLTVTLRDAYGNAATGGHASAFAVSSSDDDATIAPTSLTIGAGGDGTGTVNVRLVTAGPQSVTLTHTQLGTRELTTTVKPAAASKLTVTDLPPTVTAGVGAAVVVRVTDTYGNVVSGYGGVVNVSSSDDAVQLDPGASLTFPAGAASVTLTATFETAGPQSLELLDTGLGAGGSDATSTTVKPAAARDLVVTPDTGDVVAGAAFSFTVTLYDAFGNVATGYTGTVSFSSNDAQATLPANTPFTSGDAGAHGFSATLRTAGTRRITATGTGLAGAASDDLQRVVSASPTLHHFGVVPSPSTVTAGGTLSATVTPYDTWNNVITGFGGSVTMTVDDPGGTIPSPVTMSGATTVSPIKLLRAGTTQISATSGSVSNSGSVTVTPAAPDHLAFAPQPGDGYAASPLPAFKVAVYDKYDNVATNMAPATINLTMGRNAGPGHLGGTTSAATASGVATFATVQIDAPGRGYDLVATGAAGSVRSDRFDVTWRPATLVGTPFVSGSGGCRDIYYTLAQANDHPTDVRVEYRIGSGPWRTATQRPGAADEGEGTRGVKTSAAGVDHAFLWDVFADVGANDATVTARVTPVIDGVAGAGKTTASFGASYAWSLSADTLPMEATITPGPIAVGDFDRNGRDDILVMSRDSGMVDVFFQMSQGTFVETPTQVDLSQLDLVDIAAWQPGEHHTKGFFALSRLDSLLYVFTRSVQGPGAVGWSYAEAQVCPSPATNTPVALAIGDVYDSAALDAVVACNGDGGQTPPSISVVIDSGQGWLRGTDVVLGKRPTAVAIADLGHDGFRDIVIGDSAGLRTLINQYGDGFCQSTACGGQAITMPAPKAVAVADFDYDGQLDALAVNGTTTAYFVRGDVITGPQGNPEQYFSPQAQQLALDVAGSSVTARDVNDDGVLDVVVGSLDGDAVQILLGGDLASWGVIAIAGAEGKGVNSVWVGDIDGDGRADVVAGRDDLDAPAVALLAGKPFQQCRPSFETAGAAPFMAGAELQESADLDGDGRLDTFWMATYDAAVRGLLIGYGDGAGGYQRGYAAYVTTREPSDMALGDLDDDGLMDAVLNDGYTDNVDVALQDPDAPGTFYQGYAPTYFEDASYDSLTIVDADNDGRNDLFYLGGGFLRRYYGSGGTLQAATSLSLMGGSPSGLGTADVNKDGYQDFAYYGYINDGRSVCLRLSSGARTYAATESCVYLDSSDGRVHLVDLDGDGVEEMVYVSLSDYYQPTLVAVRRQQTPDAGDFGAPEEFPTCHGGTSLRFSDVDADGLTDIVVSCGSEGGGSSANAVFIAYQAPDGSFGEETVGFGTYDYTAWGLTVADVDGDLRDDVTLGAATVMRDPDTDAFETARAFPASDGTSMSLMDTADLDGNGLVDVVAAGGQRFSVILQPEPGKLVAPTTYTLSDVSSVYGLAVDDVSGDGRPDVVVGLYTVFGQRQVRVYRQNLSQAGAFAVGDYTALTPTGSAYPTIVVVDDFAGAGVPSILSSQATYSGQDEFDVFLQGVTGSFTKIPSDPYTSTLPTQVIAAGFGWFGRTDFREPWVAGSCNGSPCLVVTQLGTCDLSPPLCYKTKTSVSLSGSATAPLYHTITGAAVADLDKDGFDDLVVSLRGNNNLHVYAVVRQDRTKPGEFLPLQAYAGAPTSDPREIRLADVDHDGRLDIIGKYGAGSTTAYEVLRGLGTGASFGYGLAVATGLGDSDGGFAVRDMDRDGWPDLLTLSTYESELLLAPQR